MKKLFTRFTVIIFMLSCLSGLTGCIAAAVTGGVVVAGTLVYYHKRIQGYVSDKTIAFIANNRLYGNKELYAENHIVIGVYNGTVLLVGQVSDEKYKQQAEDLVKNIDGVERVYDEIVIGPNTSVWRQSKDDAITAQIKSKMLVQSNFDVSAVKVITEDSVVYLMGVVSPSQADMAINIARDTAGVTKVVKVFQYINS